MYALCVYFRVINSRAKEIYKVVLHDYYGGCKFNNIGILAKVLNKIVYFTIMSRHEKNKLYWFTSVFFN